jgi:precorrin-6B methylase 2
MFNEPDPLYIEGWMTPDELQWLEQTAGRMESIAEIGCWKGRSTSALLRGSSGPVYAIDHWKGSPGDQDANESEAAAAYLVFLANIGSHPRLQIVATPSVEALLVVPQVDMVFIDGSHRYEDVLADIRAWRGKAKKLLAGHDIGLDSVLTAVYREFGRPQRAAESIWYLEGAQLRG